MSLEDLLFSFNGRIRRSHWWLARIVLFVVEVVAFIAYGAVKGLLNPHSDAINALLIAVAIIIVASLILWCSLALNVKRLHDLGWSGWVVLTTFIPIIGGLFALVCMGIIDGNPDRNRFGPSPKFPDREAEVFA